MASAYIGLGSNLGNRDANLKEAIERIQKLPSVQIHAVSSVKETDPVEYLQQPKFLNQVILVSTQLSPPVLLSALLSIESAMGRFRTIEKGPRSIDLDILLYDNLIMETPSLSLPHPGIPSRSFVIEHLLELNPDLRDPVTGANYSSFLLKKYAKN